MDYKVSKRSLRAKILVDSFKDLGRGFKNSKSTLKLAECIKTYDVDLFKIPEGFCELDIKKLFFECSDEELKLSVIGALRGFYDSRPKDCEFVPLMDLDEYNEVHFSNHTDILQESNKDSIWLDCEKDLVRDLYSRGHPQKKIYSHYLKCCEGGIYEVLGEVYRPKSYGAIHQFIGREIKSGVLKRQELDWTGDLGMSALWLKGLEKKNKSYGHVERVRQSLNSYFYDGDDVIKYNKLAGFFDSTKNRGDFKGLEKQLMEL